MEKIPDLKIGDQEFQRVSEMKSENTELKHAPKSFELYQDTESGALMGKLSEDHPNKDLVQETQKEEYWRSLENLDVDLTQLSPDEVLQLLSSEEVKIYGKLINSSYPSGSEKQELEVHYFPAWKRYIIWQKRANRYNHKLDIHQHPDYQPHVVLGFSKYQDNTIEVVDRNKILAKTVTSDGGNDIDETHRAPHVEGVTFEFAFTEIPKGYKELMEKKEGKAK